MHGYLVTWTFEWYGTYVTRCYVIAETHGKARYKAFKQMCPNYRFEWFVNESNVISLDKYFKRKEHK